MTIEHLTEWQVAVDIMNSSVITVAKVLDCEVMHPFGPSYTITSVNAGCFITAAVAYFMKKHGNTCNTVLACAPMSNGRAERMVKTIKTAVKKMVDNQERDWQECLTRVLYGCCLHLLCKGASLFELMVGTVSRMDLADSFAVIENASYKNGKFEQMSSSALRAEHQEEQMRIILFQARQRAVCSMWGIGFLVAHG